MATRIPINPASAEQTAPTIKETATIPLDPTSLLPLKYRRIATATTKIERILYSALRKDIAPSAIFLAILAIFSFPTSCLATQLFLKKTNSNAKIPKAGKSFIINSMFNFLFEKCGKNSKTNSVSKSNDDQKNKA